MDNLQKLDELLSNATLLADFIIKQSNMTEEVKHAITKQFAQHLTIGLTLVAKTQQINNIH
jgi:hypothetical protein